MAVIAIRTIITYIIVLFAVRLMGKSELSKLSPFQMVITFMIAELAAIPIESNAIPMSTGIIAIITLVFLQVCISYISIKSETFKNFVAGKPSLLIDHGKINVKELKGLRMSINDLLEQLRLANASNLTDVDYAIMESNGNLSVVLKPENRPPTSKDMGIPTDTLALPCVVLSDGIVYEKNLKKLGFDRRYLEKFVKSLGYSMPAEDKDGSAAAHSIFMVFCDENKQLHLYKEVIGGFAESVTGGGKCAH